MSFLKQASGLLRVIQEQPHVPRIQPLRGMATVRRRSPLAGLPLPRRRKCSERP